MKGVLPVKDTISWADEARDLSAWLGNDMQRDAFYTASKMEQSVKSMGDPTILKHWRYLLHKRSRYYYMAQKRVAMGMFTLILVPILHPTKPFINFSECISGFFHSRESGTGSIVGKSVNNGEHERQKQNEIVLPWALNVDQDHRSKLQALRFLW